MTKSFRFNCAQCGGNSCKVLESRPQADWVRRRIMCQSCNHRSTSYEISERQFLLYETALASHLKQLQVVGTLRAIAAELESLL